MEDRLQKNRGVLLGRYDASVYSKEAVLKAAYKFIDDWYIHITMEDGYYVLSFLTKDEKVDSNIVRMFENELLSATVRLQVYKQTHVLREVMLGRAMASTIIVDDEENDNEPEEDLQENSLDGILKDWFKDE